MKDDSIGEAFDKVWRLLVGHLERLGAVSSEQLARWRDGPAGAALEELAKSGSGPCVPFSVPMAGRRGFSFSGLKAQVARRLAASPPTSLAEAAAVADAFQTAAVEHVAQQLHKSLVALREEKQQQQQQGAFSKLAKPVRLSCFFLKREKKNIYIFVRQEWLQVVVSGGVAANKKLQERLRSVPGAELFVPSPGLCMDNGVMIAWAGLLARERGAPDESAAMWFDAGWALGPPQPGSRPRMMLNQ